MSSASPGAIGASDATIPGAPWHHWVRIGLCGFSGGSSDGGHCARSPSRCAWRSSDRDGPALQLRPPRLVQQAASAPEHVDVSGPAVRGAQVVHRPSVEVLLPEIVAPRLPQPVGGRPPRPRPGARPRSARAARRRRASSRASPTSAPAWDCRRSPPPPSSRRSSCPCRGARRWATSRIPASPISSDGTGPPPVSSAKSGRGQVALVQPRRDPGPVARQLDGTLPLAGRPAPRSPRSRRGRAT